MLQGRGAILRSGEFLGLALFIFSVGFPPLDDAGEVDLTVHMVQHILIIFSGVLIAYPHLGRRMRGGGGRLVPWVAFAACALVIVFWHFPGPWDAAVLNPGVHVVEHLSFLAAGFLSGSTLMLLSDSGKIGALLTAFFGHMAYAVALVSPWNVQFYPLYSLPDQIVLGWVLLLTGPSILIGVAYVVARNPDWLAGFSGRATGGERRETFFNRARVPPWVAPALSFTLVFVLVVYFAATAYALGTSGGVAGTKVYIDETPVSWQYSPQSIRLVIGVNATVTWVSHSISYDTVTDRGGAFDSGAIPPGGTFSYTFTKPGVYDYYCLFHPWMTGTVTVMA